MKIPSLFDDGAEAFRKVPEVDYNHIKGPFDEGLCLLLNTTDHNPHRAEILGIGLSRNQQQAVYVPIRHQGAENVADALPILKQTLQDPSIKKIGHDLKSHIIALKRHGIELRGPLRDTMIASYLLDSNRSNHHLEGLSEEYLQITLRIPDKLRNLSLEEHAELIGERLLCIRRLEEVLFKRLSDSALEGLYNNLEEPLIPILAEMEMVGVKIDSQRLKDLSKELEEQLGSIKARIYSIAGERFNINSTQQLGHILFEKLHLKPTKKTKTGYSTDIDTLSQLATVHELPAEILNYRTLSKLKNTYLDALVEMISPQTGRVHTTLHQAATATGRLSSSDPNLQNIPIRGDWGSRIREAFVAEEGCLLLSSDYSQIELRVLAHMSGDERLIEAFRADKDIHTATAALLFKVSEDHVSREMRRVAKVVNFGILYGMSPYGLSEALKIGTTEAAEYIDNYFNLHRGVKDYIERAIQSARDTGFAYTLFGRRRAIGDINSTNKTLRQQAERIAVNTPIQGTAADLIKIAMIRVNSALKAQGLTSRLILQIHDELLFETPCQEVETLKGLVKREMEGVETLSVPLKVDIHHGPNWGGAH
jgi:DNA polymerase-1